MIARLWWRTPYPTRALLLLPTVEAGTALAVLRLGAPRPLVLAAALLAVGVVGVAMARFEARHDQSDQSDQDDQDDQDVKGGAADAEHRTV